MSLSWAIFFSEDGKGDWKEMKTVLQKIERNRDVSSEAITCKLKMVFIQWLE
jgi:hypothetical protein